MEVVGGKLEVFEHVVYKVEHNSFGECADEVFDTFDEAFVHLQSHGKSAGYYRVVKVKQKTERTIYLTNARKIK